MGIAVLHLSLRVGAMAALLKEASAGSRVHERGSCLRGRCAGQQQSGSVREGSLGELGSRSWSQDEVTGMAESHTVTPTGLSQLPHVLGAAAGHVFMAVKKELQDAAEVGWVCCWCSTFSHIRKFSQEMDLLV